jgi:8-oxo-dGTP pyrophosphatase MutT (NUDIX family)
VDLNAEILERLERLYGHPEALRMEQAISEPEYHMVRSSQVDGRAHDITLFVLWRDRLAVIRKPLFPPGVYRAPSGGLRRGEDFEVGTAREAQEETGLQIVLERYLLRVQVRFHFNDHVIHWTTHVFSARALHDQLAPQDHQEIAEARWTTWEELQGPIRQALLLTGRGLFAYRAALTDRAVARLAPDTAPQGRP